MTEEEIRNSLLRDLIALNIDVKGFEIVLKPYSKSYYGRYMPKYKRVIVYLYEDIELQKQYSYEEIFSTVLHEVVHHIQWSKPDFERVKGVMHNADFYNIYNGLMRRHKIYKSVNRR